MKRERELEALNRTALKIVRKVTDETGTLRIGNLSNSEIYSPDEERKKEIFEMFNSKAFLALKATKEFGKGINFFV